MDSVKNLVLVVRALDHFDGCDDCRQRYERRVEVERLRQLGQR